MPEDDIDQIIDRIRANNYQLFKGELKLPKTYRPSNLADFNITSLRINSDSNRFLGKPLMELNLSGKYDINILVIKRRDELIESIQPTDILRQGDILYIQDNQGNIEEFHQLIK